jgi:hypothetical protein
MSVKNKMSFNIPDKCPGCGLILLHGSVVDAIDESDNYGPILGLHKDANTGIATAGYVGLSSWFDPEHLRDLYRCPRCGIDPVIEKED